MAPAAADPFAELRAAYAARDAAAAAAAYEPDAIATYRYDGVPEEIYRGRSAIETSFRNLFAQLETPPDLNFRVRERNGDKLRGVYRLRLSPDQVSYGTFDVMLGTEGKFLSDMSSSATAADFEMIPGPVMLDAADDTLDPVFYAQMTGRYRLDDGCELIVTRSVARLLVRNSCSGSWRGLYRGDALNWLSGDTVLSDVASWPVQFAAPENGKSPSLSVSADGQPTPARRADPYRREEVSFSSSDGTRLTGTLYLPTGGTQPRAATVMVHGSGPQDRDGYASIIAVMADALAASGRVVLTYDKRGVGGSGGDWSRAGFDTLAADGAAGMAFLAARPEVDRSRIGFAGSSQAGWVVAAAIASGAEPADVFLLGAAGTALTVEEQNLYNTEVRMRCTGIPESDIKLALDQQRAFFAFLADPSKAAELDALTAQAATRPGLIDWLFPNSTSIDRSAGAWYVVLDPRFDPLPIWRDYNGKTVFVFAEHDDSTPTEIALGRLAGTSAEIHVLAGSQHLALNANDVCHAELTDASTFSAEFFTALSAYAVGG